MEDEPLEYTLDRLEEKNLDTCDMNLMPTHTSFHLLYDIVNDVVDNVSSKNKMYHHHETKPL